MNLDKYYKEVETFNEIAGNLHNALNFEKINNQIALILEEAKEAQRGADTKSYDEVLDGAVDTFVTLSGLIQQLNILGYDIDNALLEVCSNNLTKFVKADRVDIDDIIYQTVRIYREKGIYCIAELNTKYNVYVFKNADTGKILKPYGYKSVHLQNCLPEVFHD